jgi:hypothetical protein
VGVLAHPIAEERIVVVAAVREDVLDRVRNVLEIDAIVSHSAAASARIRFCKYGPRPPSVRTSTGRPRSASRSCSRAMTSSSVRPGSISTSKSMSLFGRASPRTIDPNTRTGVMISDKTLVVNDLMVVEAAGVVPRRARSSQHLGLIHLAQTDRIAQIAG